MSALPNINIWAQWLSDHSLAITLALALCAWVSEATLRAFTSWMKRPVSQKSTRQWLFTWLNNAALLACAMAISWLLGPWLSPWFSDALSGNSGLLVWLGFAHGPLIAHNVVGIFVLDLLAYVLHRVMHSVPILWRVHQVHHSDTAMNASTHFRQHPLQLIATTAMQLALLWLLGIPGISWVLYALLASAVELWHHAAMRLPVALDRWLGLIVVTPNFHRTHHLQERKFHDANYSAVFPIWDRLFGTAATSPVHAPLGLRRWAPKQAGAVVGLDACLVMPFQVLSVADPKDTVRRAPKSNAGPKLPMNYRGKP